MYAKCGRDGISDYVTVLPPNDDFWTQLSKQRRQLGRDSPIFKNFS
jgi:hypothetical protein